MFKKWKNIIHLYPICQPRAHLQHHHLNHHHYQDIPTIDNGDPIIIRIRIITTIIIIMTIIIIIRIKSPPPWSRSNLNPIITHPPLSNTSPPFPNRSNAASRGKEGLAHLQQKKDLIEHIQMTMRRKRIMNLVQHKYENEKEEDYEFVRAHIRWRCSTKWELSPRRAASKFLPQLAGRSADKIEFIVIDKSSLWPPIIPVVIILNVFILLKCLYRHNDHNQGPHYIFQS